MKTTQELHSALAGHYGSESAKKFTWINSVWATEGFQDLLEKAECLWLMTDFLCLLVQPLWAKNVIYPGQTFLFRINVDKDAKCKMQFMDGDYKVLGKWKIPFTTFPLGEYEFYIGNFNGEPGKMLCFLKTEY